MFAGARALPGDERQGYLTRACGGNEALRLEVESLLASDDRAKTFLESPAVIDTTRHSSSTIEGQRLGVYQIQALLGAGGMGEVYRARDTKLERDVAVKFLPHAFTSDRDRLARFEGEARMLAALNHPNIGAIYGFEEADGLRFLVLELVEGQTLAERLADGSRQRSQGPGLPIRDVLSIARQIAEALDIAHEKGIIHRDLKPANIKITPDGVVKVLDFGLAKVAGAASTPDLTHSPTKPANQTSAGAVVGTAGYMSPEQARGQVVDKRTDIWAFGCVLYEMLTGRVAFTGGTVSDTIVAVLGGEPEWDALPDGTPAGVRLLLQRCLDKDPKRRLRDLGDVPFRDRRRQGRRRHNRATATGPHARCTCSRYPHVSDRGQRRHLLSGQTRGRRHLALGIRPADELQRFGHRAQLFAGRVDAGLQTRRRISVSGPRPDLGQALERRVGPADEGDGPKIRTSVQQGRDAGRLYEPAVGGVGYVDGAGDRRSVNAVPAQCLRPHVDCGP